MSAESTPSCYLSVRIKNRDKAEGIESALQERGIRVLNPCRIIPAGISPHKLPDHVAAACYRMMDESSGTVLIAGQGNDFGRDCAAEIGYTVGTGKPVYILVDKGKLPSARASMRQVLPIHVSDFPEANFVDSIEALAALIFLAARGSNSEPNP